MKKKSYILSVLLIAFIAGNLIVDFSIDSGDSNLLGFFKQSNAK